MPKQVDRMPGSWAASLDWKMLANGDVWCFTAQELDENGVKSDTIRVYAHQKAPDLGVKFKTKMVDGDLYLQAHDRT